MPTQRFKNELERNITIKLGYANAKVGKTIGVALLESSPELTFAFFLFGRFTNAREKLVLDQDATKAAAPVRKMTLFAKFLDADPA